MLCAWREFLNGKRKRKDIAKFSIHLTDNVLLLHGQLQDKTYRHGKYHAFKINDPKPRDIHKASVRDRLVHHAIYRILYPYFDQKFIFDSYSCRRHKGTHLAINRLREHSRKVSQNHTKTAWILKCDIRKFFASIDQKTLKRILRRYIADKDILWLMKQIIESFQTESLPDKGLPLGNLTSQLLVNVYMNDFDQYVKRKLKLKYYVRYADDFVLLHRSKAYLIKVLPKISSFLDTRLKLELHPNKMSLRTLGSGVDFLGWVHFPHHRVLRTATRRRMFKKLAKNQSSETLTSYLGLLSHGNTFKLRKKILVSKNLKSLA